MKPVESLADVVDQKVALDPDEPATSCAVNANVG